MPWLILFSLCIALFSVTSKAQESQLEQLLKVEIAAYQLSSAFSAYVLFTGTPKFSQQLENTIAAISPILARAETDYPDVVDKLEASLSFVETKKELVYSPDDHRLIIGLQTYQNPLYQLINDKKQTILQSEHETASLSPIIAEYFNTQISFERVLAHYIAISASSAGFIVSDISIEDNVNAFSSQIENITNKGADFKRLNTKWRFIKSNMLKNPGQTSPYITMRTASDIRKTLLNIYKDAHIASGDF